MPGQPFVQKNRTLLLAAILLFQLLLLIGMVLNSHLIILYGEKIVLQVEPVDPRSLFQGDYVRLGYSFNRLDLSKIEHDFDPSLVQYGERIYLSLLPQGDTWVPGMVTLDPGKVKDKVYLQGKALYVSDYDEPPPLPRDRQEPLPTRAKTLHASWGGIEKYFVPEGKGKEIEDHIRTGEVYAQVSVYQGKARITGLINK